MFQVSTARMTHHSSFDENKLAWLCFDVLTAHAFMIWTQMPYMPIVPMFQGCYCCFWGSFILHAPIMYRSRISTRSRNICRDASNGDSFEPVNHHKNTDIEYAQHWFRLYFASYCVPVRIWVCFVLMTPGLSKGIRCHVWPHTSLYLQITISHIRPYLKLAVSLMIADGHFINVNVNVSVYSLKSPLSSADFTIYAPGIGTLSYTVSSPLGRIQHLRTLLQL